MELNFIVELNNYLLVVLKIVVSAWASTLIFLIFFRVKMMKRFDVIMETEAKVLDRMEMVLLHLKNSTSEVPGRKASIQHLREEE